VRIVDYYNVRINTLDIFSQTCFDLLFFLKKSEGVINLIIPPLPDRLSLLLIDTYSNIPSNSFNLVSLFFHIKSRTPEPDYVFHRNNVLSQNMIGHLLQPRIQRKTTEHIKSDCLGFSDIQLRGNTSIPYNTDIFDLMPPEMKKDVR